MGNCASEPKVLKGDAATAEAPAPQEEVVKANEEAKAVVDEKEPQSQEEGGSVAVNDDKPVVEEEEKKGDAEEGVDVETQPQYSLGSLLDQGVSEEKKGENTVQVATEDVIEKKVVDAVSPNEAAELVIPASH